MVGRSQLTIRNYFKRVWIPLAL